MAVLYKYSSIKGALGMLNDRGVKLTKPTDFNDVFDCQFNVDKEQNKKGFLLFKKYAFFNIAIQENSKNNFIIKDPNYLKNLGNFILKMRKTNKFELDIFMEPIIGASMQKFKNRFTKTQKWFDDIVEQTVRDAKENTLVSCFSKKKDSLLMWSHYADSHRGVCVEFDYENSDFYDVIYQDSREQFDIMAGLQTALASQMLNNGNKYDQLSIGLTLKPFYTKSKEWSYEEEVRGVFHLIKSPEVCISSDATHYFLPMPKPKRIYIGCRANGPLLDRLLLRAKRMNIETIFLKESESKFELLETKEKNQIYIPQKEKNNLIDLLNEIKHCLEHNDHLSAFATSWVVISLCSNIYSQGDDQKAKFETFVNDYFLSSINNPEDSVHHYINASFLWDLKERFQKYGDFKINGFYGSLNLDYIKVETEAPKALNVISNIISTNETIKGRNYISFNILQFCSETIMVGERFFEKNKQMFEQMELQNIEDKDKIREDLSDCISWE